MWVWFKRVRLWVSVVFSGPLASALRGEGEGAFAWLLPRFEQGPHVQPDAHREHHACGAAGTEANTPPPTDLVTIVGLPML